MTKRFLIGIDEAGRGPLAGPVSVGGVCIDTVHIDEFRAFFPKGVVRDSKKLSEMARDKIFEKLVDARASGAIDFAVAFSSAQVIDTIGISPAIKKALSTVLDMLHAQPAHVKILLDGSLYAPAEFTQQMTIVKGDEKEVVIALASIVAKVSRDRLMAQYDAKFPRYGFGTHKGYGTRAHYDALKQYGMSPEHRRSFLSSLGVDNS